MTLRLQMNGLLLSNSWAGYHMLLNPDYKAAVQWRFVNRAIDEVENDSVRARASVPQSARLTVGRNLLAANILSRLLYYRSACNLPVLDSAASVPRQRQG